MAGFKILFGRLKGDENYDGIYFQPIEGKEPGIFIPSSVTTFVKMDSSGNLVIGEDNQSIKMEAYFGGLKLNRSSKTDDYTVLETDCVVNCTGTFTVSLPAIATVERSVFWIRNKGDGVITIEPNLLEQINDEDCLSLSPGDDAMISEDGTEWGIL